MAIPVVFLTAILKKAVVEAHYPGGVAGLLQDRPGVPQDEFLVGVPFMSSGELQEFADQLGAVGYNFSRGWAVGEMLYGEWEACPGIVFYPTRPEARFDKAWEAAWLSPSAPGPSVRH